MPLVVVPLASDLDLQSFKRHVWKHFSAEEEAEEDCDGDEAEEDEEVADTSPAPAPTPLRHVGLPLLTEPLLQVGDLPLQQETVALIHGAHADCHYQVKVCTCCDVIIIRTCLIMSPI